MNIEKSVIGIIEDQLGLNGRSASFTRVTPLLGAIPELDSMAVVGIIGLLEEHFGFVVGDDEIDGETFQTVGSLVSFVENKLAS